MMTHLTTPEATTSRQAVPDPAQTTEGGGAVRPDWRDDTGAQTAEYGIVTLAAVGFAGLLAVILSGGDVQGMLTDMISSALTL